MTRAIRPKPPLNFRFPISKEQRKQITQCACTPGDPLASEPEDGLLLTGVCDATSTLMVRPVFPGALSFIANAGQKLPLPGDIKVANGRVTDESLKAFAPIVGMLLVRVQDVDQLQKMVKTGSIPSIGAVPTHAFYGPVTLGEEFLRSALLNRTNGLAPLSVENAKGKTIAPGEKEWERLALSAFYAGNYQPMLRSGATLDAEDAGLPMPLLLNKNGSFLLTMTFGWAKSLGDKPDGPTSPLLETIPAEAFLKHVARAMREPVLSTQGADAVIHAVLNDEDTAEPWVARLRSALMDLGFGARDGSSPIEMMLREFQLCAASRWSATAIDPTTVPEQLALRDFRDLKQIANTDAYAGQISGWANRRTRALIGRWTAARLRNPLLMPAFHKTSIVDGIPTGDPISDAYDVWNRQQVSDINARVYAANFLRDDLPGGRIGFAELESVGKYHKYEPGGPGPLVPPDFLILVAGAEITPQSLGLAAPADLIAALANPQTADPHLLAEASSFRVVRAVSEVESLGYLDVINAYDHAGISLAPFHWAMASTETNPSGTCELGGFAAALAALERIHPGIDLFRTFGMAPVGRGVHERNTGKFVAALGFLDDRGRARNMSEEGPTDYMPSWRSVYRWVRVGRTDRNYGVGAWQMALKRLAAVFATPIKMSPLPHDPRHSTDERTIGTVFTSDLLIAELVRWHVKVSEGVITGGKASEYVQRAYAAAATTQPGHDRALWEARLQVAILKEIETFAHDQPRHNELPRNFRTLASPTWIDNKKKPPEKSASNPFRYTLDPQLRLLTGEFKLASPQ